MSPAPRLSTRERVAYRLGRLGFERGDDAGALPHLEQLAAGRPRFADVHYMIGVIEERRGRLEAAEQSLERALGINPHYAEARLALASVLEQRGNFDRSRELAYIDEAATDRAPVDRTTRLKLGNLQAALGDAYREAGELADAVDAYRRALARCPEFHDVRYRLAVTLRERGLPHQAIRELQQILRENPEFLDAAVQLGLTYHAMGQRSQAERHWQSVLARDPTREDVQLYLNSRALEIDESDQLPPLETDL